MAIIQLVVAGIVLGILYLRMIRREVPGPIGRAQAVVPVGLGVVSLVLSMGFFFAIAAVMGALGVSLGGLGDVPRSLAGAFFMAGLPEEAAKLLMMLLALRLFRASIRNVYEVILIGAAVGFGFTLFEEFAYGSDSVLLMVGRLVTVAGHMAFGMIMAKHLGLARLGRNRGGAYARAILIPIAIHTVFDALTGTNRLMLSADDNTAMIGTLLGLAGTIALFVLQLRVLLRFKKKTAEYCGMTFR